MRGRCFAKRSQPTAKSLVAFRWQVLFDSKLIRQTTVHAAHEVERRGVPLPPSWLHAFRWDARKAILQDRVACYKKFFSNLDCILGVPKSVQLPRNDSLRPGGCRVLHLADGRRVEHVLCARLRESLWLCHPGSMCGTGPSDVLNIAEPFDVKDLIVIDVKTCSCLRQQSCRKRRLVRRVERRNLRRIIQQHKKKFDWIVAVSHWRAEGKRANQRGVPFNFEKALKQWNTNFMKWPDGGRRQMAFWTWQRDSESEPMNAALPMRTEDFSSCLIRGVPELFR